MINITKICIATLLITGYKSQPDLNVPPICKDLEYECWILQLEKIQNAMKSFDKKMDSFENLLIDRFEKRGLPIQRRCLRTDLELEYKEIDYDQEVSKEK